MTSSAPYNIPQGYALDTTTGQLVALSALAGMGYAPAPAYLPGHGPQTGFLPGHGQQALGYAAAQPVVNYCMGQANPATPGTPGTGAPTGKILGLSAGTIVLIGAAYLLLRKKREAGMPIGMGGPIAARPFIGEL